MGRKAIRSATVRCTRWAAAAGTLSGVRIDRPAPGERLNQTGVETVPRQAATIILVRGGAETLEVLLVKRSPATRWLAGVWVFPGGAVDAADAGDGDPATDDARHRAAAVRELAEEAGVEGILPESLVKFSRWITPAAILTRFDTHFFLAPIPDGAEPVIDGAEIVDLGWFTPRAALEAHQAGEIQLIFPTIKHLEQLDPFASADALLTYAAGQVVRPIVPRVLYSGEIARVVLPGEPGYDD
jgi:8-oxo-dGTP pyrophosphatase MutT (NUDIX family)